MESLSASFEIDDGRQGEAPAEEYHERLEEFLRTLSKSRTLALLLENADRLRASVRPHIYQRVRADYARQKEEADRSLETQRTVLEMEYRQYAAEQEECSRSLEAETDRLEELEFRSRVGEYTQEAIAQQCAALKRKIDEHAARLSWLEEALARFREAGISEGSAGEGDTQQAAAVFEMSLEVRPDGTGAQSTAVAGGAEASSMEAEGGEAEERSFVVMEAAACGEEDLPVVVLREDLALSQQEGGMDASLPGQGQGAPVATPYVNGYITVLEGSRKGERFPLICSNITVGSSPGMDIRLNDPGVANFHARILFKDHRYLLENLDGVGRCYVNAVQTGLSELKDGDIIRLGEVKLRVDFAAPQS